MQSTTLRRLALLVIFGITLYFVCGNDGAQRLVLLAAESPLAQPWPTLVVDYPPQLDGLAVAAMPATQEVRGSFLFHSPLPTPLPDALPPTTTLTVTSDLGDEGWLRSPATLTFAITDRGPSGRGAGVSEYRLAGSDAWIEREYYYPPPLVGDEDRYTLEYRSIDLAHNVETANLLRFNLDLSDPSAQALSRYGESSPSGWFVSPVTFALTGADGESGLQRIGYRLDDGDWRPYTAAFTLDQGGQDHLAYRAVDYSGRLGATQTVSAWIDLTPPRIQSSPTAQLAGAMVNLADSFTIFDDESGVATTSILLDGAPYQPGQPLPPDEHVVEISAVNGAGLPARQAQRFVSGSVAYLPLVFEAD